jgi:hypothetical protein
MEPDSSLLYLQEHSINRILNLMNPVHTLIHSYLITILIWCFHLRSGLQINSLYAFRIFMYTLWWILVVEMNTKIVNVGISLHVHAVLDLDT